MATENKDTRYFIEIERITMKVTTHGFAQKKELNAGKQTDESKHRIFLTKGQYNKFVRRCIG